VTFRVSYEKNMRDRAAKEGKWLVTISVNGKHLGDDSCTVQALTDVTVARELANRAVALLKKKAEEKR
jgi:hypothetical protein